jgi:hypothetical protein
MHTVKMLVGLSLVTALYVSTACAQSYSPAFCQGSAQGPRFGQAAPSYIISPGGFGNVSDFDMTVVCPISLTIQVTRTQITHVFLVIPSFVIPDRNTVECQAFSVRSDGTVIEPRRTESVTGTGGVNSVALELTDLPPTEEFGSYLFQCTLPPNARLTQYLVISGLGPRSGSPVPPPPQ